MSTATERYRKYWAALEKLQWIGEDLNKQGQGLANKMELSHQDILDIGHKIVTTSALRSKIGKMLLANYAASGLGQKDRGTPHRLAKALAATSFKFSYIGGKGIKLILVMPDKVDDYVSKPGKNKSPFYVVAASQNYGAVRMKKVHRTIRDVVSGKLIEVDRFTDPIGKAAKRTLKKFLLQEPVSKRAISSLMRGRQIAGMTIKGIDPGKMQSSGAARISTTPKGFWPLSPAQQKEVVADFEVLFKQEASALLNRRNSSGS